MYWLSIVIFYGNVVVHGPESDGWGPRLQPDYETCIERKELLEEHWVKYLIDNNIATRVDVRCTDYYPEEV